MIEFLKGDIFQSNTEAIVNTVNTKGFMGKGLALEVKKRFPDVFEKYKIACMTGDVRIGEMHVVGLNSVANPRFIINFPTKKDWKHPSKLEYIEKGLEALLEAVKEYNIKSIALPPIGCGNGNLSWRAVKPLVEKYLSKLKNVKILVYEPKSNDSEIKMTSSRASVLRLLENYCTFDYELTLLETHKLLYFLQEFGEPLNLKFEKQYYGPYATNLAVVWDYFDKHFIQMSSHSQNPKTLISLLPEGVFRAQEFKMDDTSDKRLKSVLSLVDGYQSAYGLELLSTVHWLVKYENIKLESMDAVMTGIESWNPRKARIMQYGHVKKAQERLKEFI